MRISAIGWAWNGAIKCLVKSVLIGQTVLEKFICLKKWPNFQAIHGNGLPNGQS